MEHVSKYLLAGITVLVILWMIQCYILPAVSPFIFGGLIAILLRPTAIKLSDKFALSYKTSAIITTLVFWLCIVAFAMEILYLIYSQIQQLFLNYPTYHQQFCELFSNVFSNISQNLLPSQIKSAFSFLTNTLPQVANSFLTTISQTATAFAGGMVTGFATALPSFFLSLIMGILSSFFILVDYEFLSNSLSTISPKCIKQTINSNWNFIFTTLKKILSTYLLLICITFGIITTGLWLLGVKYFAAMGFLIAILDLLPIVGSGLVMLPWGISIILLGNAPQGIGILILYATTWVFRSIMEPKLLGDSLGLHPLIMIISIYLGIQLFGVTGIIIMPAIATLVVQIYKNQHKKI